MEQEQILQTLAEKTNKTLEQLNQELVEIHKTLEQMPVTEEDKKTIALRRLVSSYRKTMSSRAETFEGIFIRAMPAMNILAKRRADAEKMFKDDKEECVAKGITNEDGTPLFYEEQDRFAKMPDWARKQRFEEKEGGPLVDSEGKTWIGKTMPESEVHRTINGVAKVGDKYISTVFRTRGKNAEVKVPLFVQLKFNGLKLQTSTEELIRINDAGDLNISVIKQLSDSETENLLKAQFPANLLTLDKFEGFVAQHAEFDRFIIAKVMVTEIMPQKTVLGATMITIEDDTMEILDEDTKELVPPIMCFIQNEDLLNFPEKSEIWIIGKPNITDRGKNLEVHGIFTPAIYRNLVPVTKSVTGEKKW